MKASKSSIGRSVDQPDPKVRLYLFLGRDESQSRSLAARLLEALGAQKFVIAAAEVKANPSVLADEAAALSLFGDRRLIWVEPATADILEGAEALLAAASVESPVAAIAGALPKSAALLKLAEASPNAIAFTAYAPEGDDAARMVADLGRRVGLEIAPPVAARVAETCGNDQAIVVQELEKFALYLGASPHSPKRIEQETIDAVGAGSDEGDLARLADLALLGDLQALAAEFSRLPPGSDAIPLIRSLQRRLLMLAPGRARVERGERIDAVMASLGKALFWKDKATVAKMIERWSAQDLAKVAERAGELERSLLFSEAPERETLGEELVAIARKARKTMR